MLLYVIILNLTYNMRLHNLTITKVIIELDIIEFG